MKIFEISKQEFEGRFGNDLLIQAPTKIWLVNDTMAIVAHKSEVIAYGDTELSEEEEFQLLEVISPEFKIDDEKPKLKKLEEYEQEALRVKWAQRVITLLPITIIGLLILLFGLLVVIY